MSDTTIWEPVNFIALADGLEIHVDEIAMTIGRGDTALATHAWPEDGNEYAICRQVPDGGVIRATPSPVGASVPSDLCQTLRMALRDSKEYTDSIRDLDEDYKAKWRVKIDAALTWLQQQQGQG